MRREGGGGGRDYENIAKENKVGFTKVLSKFIIFLPLKLLILSLKITRKFLLAFIPFTPRPSYGEMTRCFNLHLWTF